MKLNLLDADNGTVCMANLRLQRSFIVQWANLSLDGMVQEFRAVIGENGELVHCGDFVKLSSAQYEGVY